MDLQLRDKVVVIAGASGVIGAAAARVFAREGAQLALLARSVDRLDALRAELLAAGAPRVLAVGCDLTSPGSTDAAIAQVLAQCSRIDVLVAAAGAAQGGVFWEIDDAQWHANLELKLHGTIRLLRAVIPSMLAAHAGRIVVVAGNAGRQPEPRMLPGAVANAGLLALVRGLAEELGPRGVAINALNPGPVRSSRWDSMMQAAAKRDGVELATAEQPFLDRSALRRLAEPEEIAVHIVFLASARAAHLTGTSVTVDGGSTKSL
jgi:NAD(P)-dependent dehydrogenase (short-subunit alcohol dehydrogenase family)